MGTSEQIIPDQGILQSKINGIRDAVMTDFLTELRNENTGTDDDLQRNLSLIRQDPNFQNSWEDAVSSRVATQGDAELTRFYKLEKKTNLINQCALIAADDVNDTSRGILGDLNISATADPYKNFFLASSSTNVGREQLSNQFGEQVLLLLQKAIGDKSEAEILNFVRKTQSEDSLGAVSHEIYSYILSRSPLSKIVTPTSRH